mmetsp:Transcript_67285/g.217191  ORF Transcript_67285/g.217191 Transcript_67285/m.217191 type:complete len:469 (+) Transcript_67285:59-1465(+)
MAPRWRRRESPAAAADGGGHSAAQACAQRDADAAPGGRPPRQQAAAAPGAQPPSQHSFYEDLGLGRGAQRRWRDGPRERGEEQQEPLRKLPHRAPAALQPSGAAVQAEEELAPRKLPAGDPCASTLGVDAYFAAATEATSLVSRHGFIVLRDAVSRESCASVLRRCTRIADEMLAIDTKRHGNRGGGRYSLGAAAASGQQLHNAEWALLVTDPVLDALDSIYGVDNYVLCGGGGEVVLGGTDEYQDLHADISRQPPSCDTQARPPLVVVNFAVHPIAEEHGPTRIWPAHGRPRHHERPVKLRDEPQEVRRSTLAPLPVGSCVVRDARIWHGGTPNHRTYARYLPNLEFFSREYFQHAAISGGGRFNRKTMPAEVFGLLSPRAQRVASAVVASNAVPRGIKPNFVRPQGRIFREGILQKLAALQVADSFTFSGNGFECHEVKELAEAQGLLCRLTREGPRYVATATRTH